MTQPTRSARFRVLIRRQGETEWAVWGRFSSNAARAYGDAAWLTERAEIAEVAVERITTIEERLTLDELRACIADAPPRPDITPGDAR